jgi:FkbM family methyltransferase
VAPTLEHDAALGGDNFATVIDVGANKGQFAAYAHIRRPDALLICFEPLPEPRAKLQRVTAEQAEIDGCAVGAEPGEGRMHLASRTDSSSLLALRWNSRSTFAPSPSGRGLG